jgi:hypothetical protein
MGLALVHLPMVHHLMETRLCIYEARSMPTTKQALFVGVNTV